jgi:hypothetical protein
MAGDEDEVARSWLAGEGLVWAWLSLPESERSDLNPGRR